VSLRGLQRLFITEAHMPITLNAPLAWKKADAEQLKMLQALQGNILKGHGREFATQLFFKLDATKPLQSRRLLRELANHHITTAHQQLLGTEFFKSSGQSAGPFVHLALSFAGYQALGAAASAPNDPDFQGGMKSTASLAALADPPIANWEPAFQQDLHGMVLAADETAAETATLVGHLHALMDDAGATVVHIQRGAAVRNTAGDGIENFGYIDGRSQPLLLEEDIADENRRAGSVRWDPAFALDTALLKDPGAGAGDSVSVSHGSFLVFRKLEQNVRGFKQREQEVADLLGLTGAARELAGALLVGRFEDGTPVTLSDTARAAAPPNDFNYRGDTGQRCPLHAHIRKSNPRGSGGGETETQERLHLMPRRGILYEDVKRSVHPDELPEADSLAEFISKVAPLLPTGGVGLLFMAYNQKIAQQFKFTQQSWVNKSNFPAVPSGPHGIDPLIGQGANKAGDQKLFKEWDNSASPVVNNAGMAGFVTMKGGEYFFSPSLTFLRGL
jgi:Dyp-type peroxidase family